MKNWNHKSEHKTNNILICLITHCYKHPLRVKHKHFLEHQKPIFTTCTIYTTNQAWGTLLVFFHTLTNSRLKTKNQASPRFLKNKLAALEFKSASSSLICSCSCSCSCCNSAVCQAMMRWLNTRSSNSLGSRRTNRVGSWWRCRAWSRGLEPTRVTGEPHVWVRRWLTNPWSCRTFVSILVLHYGLVNKRNETLHFDVRVLRESKGNDKGKQRMFERFTMGFGVFEVDWMWGVNEQFIGYIKELEKGWWRGTIVFGSESSFSRKARKISTRTHHIGLESYVQTNTPMFIAHKKKIQIGKNLRFVIFILSNS